MRKIILAVACFLFSSVSVTATDLRDVVINEIAWMGTTIDYNDEWIELRNNTSADVDFTNWTLAAEDGTPLIILSGMITAGGFFLLERTDETTISDIFANQIYTGALGNTGEHLILKDANGVLIDEVNASSQWFAGNNSTKTTMERIDPTADGNDLQNWASNNELIMNGIDADSNSLFATPNSRNSVSSIDNPSPPVDTIPPITTANPVGGSFAVAQSVILSADEQATIFYSLDAEVAKDDFLEYSDPIEIIASTMLRFFARDEMDNEEEVQMENYTIDFVSPENPTEFLAMTGDTIIDLSWTNSVEDFEGVLVLQSMVTISAVPIVGQNYSIGDLLEDAVIVFIGNNNEFSVEDLTNGSEYFFKIFAFDVAKNYSNGSEVFETPSSTTIEITADLGEVVFNEIAWAGSTTSATDEWIELRNTTSNKIFNLTGWKILTEDGTPEIALAGELRPNEFFLLERTDDTTVPTISADQIYTGGIGNTGETLSLFDFENSEIDCVDGSNSWEIGGENDSKKTLARINSENFRTSFEADGTPATANFFDYDLAIFEISANPVNPLPGELVEFYVTIENRGRDSENFEIIWLVDGLEVSREIIENLASFAMLEKTFSQTFTTGVFEISATVEFLDDENYSNNFAEMQNFSIMNHLVINEFIPNPEGLDDGNEWVEFFNPTEYLINLENYKINGTSISGSIEPGGFFILENWSGLTNTSGEIVLKNSVDEIIDSKNYLNAVEKKSFGRNSINLTEWYEFFHPTCGSLNLLPEANEPPIAAITIQGSGNSNGNCSLFVNLTAEHSSDTDDDDLIFEWDFGNGSTFDGENPSGFYFSPGNYEVRLIVTDTLGTASEVSQNFVISECSGGSGSSSLSSSETDEPVFDSISAERVVMKISEVSFDSDADWIEIQMLDDGNSGHGIDIGGFYFEVDKRIKTIPKNIKMKTNDFLILKFKSENSEKIEHIDNVWKIYSEKSGLTKTDEQILLCDSAGRVEDAVVWENCSGDWSRGEDDDMVMLVSAGAWMSIDPSAAINSTTISREMTIARFADSRDTDTAEDWFVSSFATPGYQNTAPPVCAEDVEILISEVAFRNSNGDHIKIFNQTLSEKEISLAGFYFEFGQTKIFEFSNDVRIQKGEEIEIIFGADEDWQDDSLKVFYLKRSGLTATDGLLALKDFSGEIVDFIGWSNRIAPPSRDSDLSQAEMTQLEKYFQAGEWNLATSESLLNSQNVPRENVILRLNFTDTNSADDWEVVALTQEIFPTAALAGEVRISEIFPNPIGSDAGAEWLELENLGDSPVNLLGWQIVSGTKSYKFTEDIVLAPHEFRSFTELLSLRNNGAILSLLSPGNVPVDSINFPKLDEGLAWARGEVGWTVTNLLTPNKRNKFFRILSVKKDTDRDGISDVEELEIGTNLEEFDTDGDALPDFFEIYHNFNPVVWDSCRKVIREYREELSALAMSQLSYRVNENEGVFLAGIGIPRGTVRIYIHPVLSIVEVSIDENGKWDYILDYSLEAGWHDIFIQMVDPSGVEGVAQKVLNFNFTKKFIPPKFAEEIRISEFLPNPIGKDADGEWIELQNFGAETADVSNFRITNGSKSFLLPEPTIISAGEFLVLSCAETGLSLSNSGGVLTLMSPIEQVISTVSYKKIRENTAVAWSSSEFRETLSLTPGFPNKILTKSLFGRSTKKINRNGDFSNKVVVSEILANPVAADTAAEWIELTNLGSHAINLGNWQLDDAAGGSRPFIISDTVILQPGEFRIFPKTFTKITLNNSGTESVRLFNYQDELISSVDFSNPVEGVSLARDIDGEIRATKIITPNGINKFDTVKFTGTIKFVDDEGFVIQTSTREEFIKFGAENDALLARAVFSAADKWRIFAIQTEDAFVLTDFKLPPDAQHLLTSSFFVPVALSAKLLESNSSTITSVRVGVPTLELLTLLIFMIAFWGIRQLGKIEKVWNLKN